MFLPREGYDGQVTIRTKAIFYDSEGNDSRSSVIFHELAENYERTTNNVGYSGESGAHRLAIKRENKWSGASSSPGTMSIGRPVPSKKSVKVLNTIIRQYKSK